MGGHTDPPGMVTANGPVPILTPRHTRSSQSNTDHGKQSQPGQVTGKSFKRTVAGDRLERGLGVGSKRLPVMNDVLPGVNVVHVKAHHPVPGVLRANRKGKGGREEGGFTGKKGITCTFPSHGNCVQNNPNRHTQQYITQECRRATSNQFVPFNLLAWTAKKA